MRGSAAQPPFRGLSLNARAQARWNDHRHDQLDRRRRRARSLQEPRERKDEEEKSDWMVKKCGKERGKESREENYGALTRLKDSDK